MSVELRDQLQLSLGGAYHVERELGGGGMSRVFVAEERALARRVVVKVLSPELSAAISAERFHREIQLAASLQHAYIVPVLQAGEAEGLPYYTMPLVEGESLRSRLARSGALPIRDAVHLLRDVAEALAYAHAHGVIHRDIKPDNILLAPRHALVTDFGVGKALSVAADATRSEGGSVAPTLTATGVVVGTPAYMAPEQAAADPHVDHRADLYALGVVAYEMLTGRVPFGQRTPAAVLKAQICDMPEPVKALRGETPAALAGLVMRLLAKDPAARPQSAEEILYELEHLGAAVARSGSRESRNNGRRRLALLGTAAAALVIIAGVGSVAAKRLTHDADVRSAVRTIAVLPFSNVGRDTTLDYFSDGMTDDLTGALSEIPALRVISRTSAFAFKNQRVDIREVGRRLGATHVLEGTVQRSGDRLRVRVHLTRVSDGTAVWTESYERGLQDVFAVQDDIAKSVVRGLQVRLSDDSASHLVHRGTESLAAYDLYLQGQFYENKGDEASLKKSLDLYRQALAVDPSYAPAWVGIAESYGWISDEFLAPDSSLPQSAAAARKAIALDPDNAAAHAVLSNALLTYDHDLVGTERELNRAFALKRDPGTAFVSAGVLFIATGRPDSAIRALRGIEALDPLNPVLKGWNAWMLVTVDRYDEAIEEARRALELDPSNPYAYLPLGDALRQKGDMRGAMEAYRNGLALGNRARAALASLDAAVGKRAEALALLDSLLADARQRYVGADVIASVYAALGDRNEAFRWLDRGLRDRCGQLIFAGFDHRWDPLRGDPRFAALMRKLGLSIWRRASS